MEVKTFYQIEQSMMNYIISHQDKLTDFNEGSVLSSFNEAHARELAMLYIRCRVGFSTYLKGLPYSVFNFKRKLGQKASTTVIFSRSKTFSYETRIPKGTVVKAGGLKFLTSDIGAIPADELNSGQVPVIASEVGKDYNVGQGLITTIESILPSDVVSVNNNFPAAGGVDKEDFAAYMDRFGDYILGLQRTNGFGFKSGLTRDYIIRSMEIVEHFPPEENIWNVTVYLEDGTGGITPEAIEQAKAVIDGDGTSSNGGYRAPGINVRYLPPAQVPINLRVSVTTRSVESSIASLDVEKAVREYVNGLKIGQDVIHAELVIVLKRIPYVNEARVLEPADTINIDNSQIARYMSCDITVVVE
jgi:uncharacterized phage protein gp47/JayE